MDSIEMIPHINAFADVILLNNSSEEYAKRMRRDLEYLIVEKNCFESPEKLRGVFLELRQYLGDWRYSTYVSKLRRFVKWAARRKMIPDWVPIEMEDIKPVPKNKRKNVLDRFAYTIEQAKMIIENTRNETEKMIYWMALNTGIRRNALMSLEIGDVDPKGRFVIVRAEITKNRKKRKIPFPNHEQREIVRDYLFYRDQLDAESNYFFVSPRGRKINWQGGYGYRSTKRLSELLGFRVALHNCRYTFAVRVWEKTNDLFLVQKLLGHSNPNITANYLKLREKDLDRNLERKLVGVRFV